MLLFSMLTSSLALAQDTGAAAAPSGPFQYQLSPGQSLLYVRTYADTSLTHEHAIHASGWSGKVTWDPQDASACKVSITVPVAGLIVDDSNTRKIAGITDEGPGQSDREKIKGQMLSDDQLDSGKFSTITYQSTSCSGTTGQVKVKGNLTIHGVSKSMEVTMNVSADASTFSAQGGFTLTHADFGLEPFSFPPFVAAFKNGPKLTFGVSVKGSAS